MKTLKYILIVLALIVIAIFAVKFINSKSEVSFEASGQGASVSVQSVKRSDNSSLASAGGALSLDMIIKWQTSNYPKDAGVDINLLKKVSNSPVQYSLARVIAKDISDTGEAIWTPLAGETGSDLYIEVTCGSSYQFQTGCSMGAEPVSAY